MRYLVYVYTHQQDGNFQEEMHADCHSWERALLYVPHEPLSGAGVLRIFIRTGLVDNTTPATFLVIINRRFPPPSPSWYVRPESTPHPRFRPAP